MRRASERNSRGFLLLEILISALIIAGAVASAMYLFRLGFQFLEKLRVRNELNSKVPQAVSYLSSGASLEKGAGTLKLGEEVDLRWQAREVERVRPMINLEGEWINATYEISLYAVNFTLTMVKTGDQKNYTLYVTKYKSLYSPQPDF